VSQPNQTAQPPSGPQLIAILKLLQSNLPARFETMDHQTVVMRARYAMLMDKGFTEHQAIHLCVQDWGNCI
jgi:hypothetical protein